MAPILVVADSVFHRSMVRNTLRMGGYRSVEAQDGGEALDILRSQALTCVIADMIMPDMDGCALLEAVRAGGLAVPVVVLTSGMQESVRTKCMELGAAAIIGKPFRPGEMLRVVDDLASAPLVAAW